RYRRPPPPTRFPYTTLFRSRPARERTPVPELADLLHYVVDQRGSDLHLKAGSRPCVRVDGHLRETDFDALTPADTERIAFALMRSEEHTSELQSRFDLVCRL